MILERAGNSPALTAFCLPLSANLKVFNGFNDPNVLKAVNDIKEDWQFTRSHSLLSAAVHRP